MKNEIGLVTDRMYDKRNTNEMVNGLKLCSPVSKCLAAEKKSIAINDEHKMKQNNNRIRGRHTCNKKFPKLITESCAQVHSNHQLNWRFLKHSS